MYLKERGCKFFHSIRIECGYGLFHFHGVNGISDYREAMLKLMSNDKFMGF